MKPIKKRINLADVAKLRNILRGSSLNTVCENARCPNIGECFGKGVATFLIAGSVCTRSCRFCAIDKGKPQTLDCTEPQRVAQAVKELGLHYVVITSVTRDDLPDGGAGHFSSTVKCVRDANPGVRIEILVPDFNGNGESVQTALEAHPDVFAHNLETVPRLYKAARAGAEYARSLAVLAQAKMHGAITKSGLMLGLGETEKEVLEAMRCLRKAGCDILTLGQYLSPSKNHLPVKEHISAEQFKHLKQAALEMGFASCASGTYVRSSYLADDTAKALLR